MSFVEIQNCKDCGGYTFPDLILRVGNERVENSSVDHLGYIQNNHRCGLYIPPVGPARTISGSIVTIPCINADEGVFANEGQHPVPGKYISIQVKNEYVGNDQPLIIGEVDVYGLSSIAGKRCFRQSSDDN